MEVDFGWVRNSGLGAQFADLRKIFDSIDVSGDGTLDYDELQTALNLYASIGDNRDTKRTISGFLQRLKEDTSQESEEGWNFNEVRERANRKEERWADARPGRCVAPSLAHSTA